MQVELSLAISIVGAVVSLAGGLYAGLLRYTIAAKERELDRREKELKKDVDDLVANLGRLIDRVSTLEKDFLKAEGDGKVATVELETAKREIDKLRTGIGNANDTLIKLLGEFRSRPGTSTSMQAVRRNESDNPPQR